MPWLNRPNDTADGDPGLLFVHVPRAGGTSLLNLFKVQERARNGVGLAKRLGRRYFSYRYRTQESANFPWKTYENAYALLMCAIASLLYFALTDEEQGPVTSFRPSYAMWGSALATFVGSTFIAVPAVVGRNDTMRNIFSWFVTYPLCGLLAADDWLIGISSRGGLLQHMTASDIITAGFVSQADFDAAETFAVVRNPFSRMVSVYGYNRIGACESFPAFVRRWRRKHARFVASGKTRERYTYSHVLPQHTFTHHPESGKQLVKTIIRQEELKTLSREPSPYSHVPASVRRALLEMPRTNARKAGRKWQQLYTPETRDAVLDMYGADFATYGYSVSIDGRPDLNESLTYAKQTLPAGHCPARLPPMTWSIAAASAVPLTPPLSSGGGQVPVLVVPPVYPPNATVKEQAVAASRRRSSWTIPSSTGGTPVSTTPPLTLPNVTNSSSEQSPAYCKSGLPNKRSDSIAVPCVRDITWV